MTQTPTRPRLDPGELEWTKPPQRRKIEPGTLEWQQPAKATSATPVITPENEPAIEPYEPKSKSEGLIARVAAGFAGAISRTPADKTWAESPLAQDSAMQVLDPGYQSIQAATVLEGLGLVPTGAIYTAAKAAKIPEGYKPPTQRVEEMQARRDESIREVLGETGPPETVLGKVGETVGGLAAFIGQLAAVGGATPGRALKGIPQLLRQAAVWESQNQMVGGATGEGALMGLGLGALGAVPKEALRTPFKVALESAGFGSLAAIQDADEVDIYINMAIPPALRGMQQIRKAYGKQLREAKSLEEIDRITKEVVEFGIQERAKQGVPETYEPTWEEVIKGVKDYEAQLSKTDRDARAKNIKEFRKLTETERQEAEVIEAAEGAGVAVTEPPREMARRLLEARKGKDQGVVGPSAETPQPLPATRPTLPPVAAVGADPTLRPAAEEAAPRATTAVEQPPSEAPKVLELDPPQTPTPETPKIGLSEPQPSRPKKLTDKQLLDQSRLKAENTNHEKILKLVDSLGKKLSPGQRATLERFLDVPVTVKPTQAIATPAPSELGEPKIIAKIGTAEIPVVQDDVGKRIKLSSKRPRITAKEDFKRDYENGRYYTVKDTPTNWEDQYRARVSRGEIRDPEVENPQRVRGGRQVETSIRKGAISLEAETKGGRTFKDIARVASSQETTPAELAAQAEIVGKLNEAFAKLPGPMQEVLGRLTGFDGRETSTPEQLMKETGLSEGELGKLRSEAEHQMRISMGLSEPGTTAEQAEVSAHPAQTLGPSAVYNPTTRYLSSGAMPRTGRPGDRPGAVSTDLLLAPFTATKALVAPIGRLANDFISHDVRDMLQLVGIHGRAGRAMEAKLRSTVVQSQNEYLGEFQPFQTASQRIINAHQVTNSKLQHSDFPPTQTQNAVGPTGNTWWVMDRMAQLLMGEIQPSLGPNPAVPTPEALLTWIGRQANLRTGKLLMEIPNPSSPTGKGLVLTTQSGAKILFQAAPDGKTFIPILTPEAYDLIGRGDIDLLAQAYSEANGGSYKDTRAFLESQIVPMTQQMEYIAGIKHVGAELQKSQYTRRPVTALRDPKTGKRIQLMATEMRQYIDSVYTNTAMRAGFVHHYGQDGTLVGADRARYVKHGGWGPAFDNAIKALSDMPPQVFIKVPFVAPHDPRASGYGTGRIFSGMYDLSKQAALSSAAALQITENFPIAAEIGAKHVAQAWLRMVPFSPSNRHFWETMSFHRAYTKDIIKLSVDMAHPTESTLKIMSQVLSRAHFNKPANEVLNERIAAASSYYRMKSMLDHKGQTPRASDINYLERLGYRPKEAIRIASGKATGGEFWESVRRSTRHLVATTTLKSQQSPLRNTRSWVGMVPFTNYFTNSVRQGLLHVEQIRQSKDIPQGLHRSAEFAKLIGMKLTAGVAATFISAWIREGLKQGTQTKIHEMIDDPLGAFFDAMIYGTFGPVYGAIAEFGRRAGTFDESSDTVTERLMDVFFPARLIKNVWDAFGGHGPYRDMTADERFQRFMYLHVPVLHTLPAHSLAGVLGIQAQSPQMIGASRAYYRWLYDPSNGAVPAQQKSPGTIEAEEKQYRIHLRRAIEAQLEGDPSRSHREIIEAFRAEKRDIGASLQARKFLDRPELDDAKREALKSAIGPMAYKQLEDHDRLIDQMIIRSDQLSDIGREIRQEKVRFKNIKLRAQQGKT